MIEKTITIKNGKLPDAPGVYFYFDRAGRLLYVGKATSLKRRVGSYFVKAHEGRIAEMVSRIVRIDYIQTPTVIEALILEANEIKARCPKYNILLRDDRSFFYLAITKEQYPRPMLIRSHELQKKFLSPYQGGPPERPSLGRAGIKGGLNRTVKFLKIFGPYTSSRSLKLALDLIRQSIPWSVCVQSDTHKFPTGSSEKLSSRGVKRRGISGVVTHTRSLTSFGMTQKNIIRQRRPCFDYQIGKCPGVCVGAISRSDYRKIIRQLIMFFDGKKSKLERELKRDMLRAARESRFEDAKALRDRLFALKHIHDIALISREDYELPFTKTDSGINLLGRIEGYDISNISGTSAVGAMVVFEDGKPAKHLYRRFRIKNVQGANDVAMLEEVIRRRLLRVSPLPDLSAVALAKAEGGLRGVGVRRANVDWVLPVLIVIDGGEPQVNRVQSILNELGVRVPILGIAKGFDRKQDRLVFDRDNSQLQRVVTRGKDIFSSVRDEAHRFAIQYHRLVRGKQYKRKKDLERSLRE